MQFSTKFLIYFTKNNNWLLKAAKDTAVSSAILCPAVSIISISDITNKAGMCSKGILSLHLWLSSPSSGYYQFLMLHHLSGTVSLAKLGHQTHSQSHLSNQLWNLTSSSCPTEREWERESACVFVCMCVCMQACMHVCMHVCVCVCMRVCMLVFDFLLCNGLCSSLENPHKIIITKISKNLLLFLSWKNFFFFCLGHVT